MPRTYALMAPDGVLEIAFQAEGISDAWIFAQDHMQRPADELGQEGFTIINVQVWPEGTRPAPVQQVDFWHTMESAPRDRDILLYIGERPADTPWVQGRYIGNFNSSEGYWSSTMGMCIQPTRWAEPPMPVFRTPEFVRVEVDPVVRVIDRGATGNESVCRLRTRNGRRGSVTVTSTDWEHLPEETRNAITNVSRMPWNDEDRVEMECDLADTVLQLRTQRIRAQREATTVNIPAEQADAFLRGEHVTVDVPVEAVNAPIVREGVEQAIRGFLQDMQTRGPLSEYFQLPDMGEQYARVDNEGVVDALFDSIPGALEDAIQRVQDMDLSDQTVVYAIHRIGNERDTTYRRRIIRELRARHNRQQQGDQWVHGGVNQPTLEGRLVYVRDTDLSGVSILYNIPREEGESDETYRDRLARELIAQAGTISAEILQHVATVDLNGVSFAYGVDREEDEDNEEYRERILSILEERQQQENPGAPSDFQSRIDLVRNADLSGRDLFYGVTRLEDESDGHFRNRIIRNIQAQGRQHNRAREQEEVAPGVVLVEHDITNRPAVQQPDTADTAMREFLEYLPADGRHYVTVHGAFDHNSLTVQLAIENGYVEWDGDRIAPEYRITDAGRIRLVELQGGPVRVAEDGRDYASIATGMASGSVLDDIARVYDLHRENAGGYIESDEALRLRLQRAIRNQRPTAPNTEHAIREMSPGVMKGVEAELKTGEMESGVLSINGQRVFRVEVVIHENMHNGVHVSTTGNTQDAVWLSKADIEITHCRGITYITLDYQYAVANGFINEYQERSR